MTKMMKWCQSLVFVVGVIIMIALLSTDAYIYYKRVSVIDNQCNTTEGLKELGERWYDDEKCEMLECVIMADHYYEQAYGCGVVSVSEGCTLVQGEGSYPDCCPQPRCPRPSTKVHAEDFENDLYNHN